MPWQMAAGGIFVPCWVTLTKNVQELVLPAASVAVQMTGVVPTTKLEPDSGLHTNVGVEQLSLVAGAAKLTTTVLVAGGAVVEMFDGQLMSNGGCVSFTMKTVEQVLVLPAVSVTVMRTALVPRP